LTDPGIAFRIYSTKGEGRSPQKHYRYSPFEELAKLPVADIAAEDCFLFLWIPPCSVYLTKPLMVAGGFKFSGTAVCWAQQNKCSPGWFMGNGYSTRHNTEDCWLGPSRIAATEIQDRSTSPRPSTQTGRTIRADSAAL
jgi:N6-adenosine-specific RNA methylase IME4